MRWDKISFYCFSQEIQALDIAAHCFSQKRGSVAQQRSTPEFLTLKLSDTKRTSELFVGGTVCLQMTHESGADVTYSWFHESHLHFYGAETSNQTDSGVLTPQDAAEWGLKGVCLSFVLQRLELQQPGGVSLGHPLPQPPQGAVSLKVLLRFFTPGSAGVNVVNLLVFSFR